VLHTHLLFHVVPVPVQRARANDFKAVKNSTISSKER
jgi:hypothetical protein